MARITVEDCIEVVPNRFDLVILAAKRVRDIVAGSNVTVERNNDKNHVIALREIGERNIDIGVLKESIITSMQRYVEQDVEELESTEEAEFAVDYKNYGISSDDNSEVIDSDAEEDANEITDIDEVSDTETDPDDDADSTDDDDQEKELK